MIKLSTPYTAYHIKHSLQYFEINKETNKICIINIGERDTYLTFMLKSFSLTMTQLVKDSSSLGHFATFMI